MTRFTVAELQSASVIFQTSNMHVQDKTYFINGCANLANISRNAAHCSSSSASDCDAEIRNFLKNAFDSATVCKAQFPSGAAGSRSLDSDPDTHSQDRS